MFERAGSTRDVLWAGAALGGGFGGFGHHWRGPLESVLMDLGLFAIRYSHATVPTTFFSYF